MAVPIVGAPGTVYGVTATVAEAALGPAALVATTEQLYVVPLINVTVSGMSESRRREAARARP